MRTAGGGRCAAAAADPPPRVAALKALSGSDGPAYHSSPQRCPVDPQKLNSFLDPSAVSTYECWQVRHAGRAVAPHTRFGTKELRRQPKRKVLPLLGLPSRKRLGSSRLLAAHV